MEKLERESNFELLRLLAMFLIVLSHFCVHGISLYWVYPPSGISSFNIYACEFLSIGGKLAVNVFVILSGYFMVNSCFKIEKLCELYLKTLFYSLLLLLCFAVYGNHHISSTVLNHSLFPIGSNNYWFISTYLMLYILVPFINVFLNNSGEKVHLALITVLGIFWSILPTFTSGRYSYSFLGWFIFLYLVGAYIKLYSKKFYDNWKFNLTSFFLMSFLSLLILFALNHSYFIEMFRTTKYMIEYSSIILIMSINLFLLFKNVKIKSRFINWAAKSVFAVYLIHDNEFIRAFLWRKLLHVANYMSSPYFILWALFISFMVFAVCILLDKFLGILFNKLMKLLNIDKLSKFNVPIKLAIESKNIYN